MSKKTIRNTLVLILIAVFIASCGLMPYKSSPDCRRQDGGVCGRASDVYELCLKDPKLCGGQR